MTINTNKKVVFKKRVPEPKEMGEEEMRAFEKMSADSYQRWMIPLVDDALSKIQVKNGVNQENYIIKTHIMFRLSPKVFRNLFY